MNGLLSQALANLLAATQHISQLTGLPQQAQAIQAATARAMAPLAGQIKTMQQGGASYVQTALPQLNEIETMVTGEQPLAAIKPRIAAVLAETRAIQASISQSAQQISAVSTTILATFNQLAAVESALTVQITGLQGQLGAAKGEEDAAKKRYYYLLALGPFGLIGLAAALGLYLKWQSDVNGYESQISGLNAQIAALSSMKAACQHLATDFQALIGKTTGVSNTVAFLGSSILNISDDVGTSASHTVLAIMVKAAITELTTLGVDLS